MKSIVYAFFIIVIGLLSACQEEENIKPSLALIDASLPPRIVEGFSHVDGVRFLYQEEEKKILSLDQVSCNKNLEEIFAQAGEYVLVCSYEGVSVEKTLTVYKEDVFFDLDVLYDLLFAYGSIEQDRASFLHQFSNVGNQDIISFRNIDEHLYVLFASQEEVKITLVERFGLLHVDEGSKDVYINTSIAGVHKVGYVKDYHLLRFYDERGFLISSEYVMAGKSGQAPVIEEQVGHDFLGWSSPYWNVQQSLDLYPVFRAKEYGIVFYDPLTDTGEVETYSYGDIIPLGRLEDDRLDLFAGWAMMYDDGEIIRLEQDYYKVEGQATLSPIYLSLPESYYFTHPLDFVVWHNLEGDERLFLGEQAQAFDVLYPALNVRIIKQDNLEEKLRHAVMTNSGPSMVISSNGMLDYLQGMDGLESLDYYVNHDEYGLTSEDILSSFFDSLNSEEGQYSLPLAREAKVLLYNKDILLEEQTVTQDQLLSFEELESLRDSLSCEDLLYLNQLEVFYQAMLSSSYPSDQVNSASLTKIKDYYDQGLIDYGEDQTSAWERFARQETCMIEVNLSDLDQIEAPDFALGLLMGMTSEENLDVFMTSGLDMGILEYASDKEEVAAYFFMRYLLDEERQMNLTENLSLLPVTTSLYDQEGLLNNLIDDSLKGRALEMLLSKKASFEELSPLLTEMTEENYYAQLRQLLKQILVDDISIEEALANYQNESN